LLLRPIQILPRDDQNVDALFNLGPFQTLLLSVGIGTQLDAAGVIVEEAITAILEGPAAAPGAVFLFQEFNVFFLRVIFSVVGCNARFAIFKPAAGHQGRPPIRLGKRKSGDLFGLRSLVDLRDLFCFGEEETQLKISSFRITSSAWALQAFIRPVHCIGSRAFSSSVAPAACVSVSIICSSRCFAAWSISARCGYSFPLRSRWL